MIFAIKEIYHFDPYNVFLAIAINIPQRLKTGFVLQGHTHIYIYIYIYIYISVHIHMRCAYTVRSIYIFGH